MVVVISLLLLCAAGTSFLFLDYPDDDTVRELTLIYEFYEGILSDELEWINSYRTDVLTYVASPNNMRVILKTQYYCEYPLAVDMESWDIGEYVNIGMYSALIVGTTDIFVFDSWECQIGNQTFLHYDMDSGILVNYEWITSDAEGEITLMEISFEQLDLRIKDAGVLLTGIFVELAVIVWLFADRLKKSD